jgi:hypothetical protein
MRGGKLRPRVAKDALWADDVELENGDRIRCVEWLRILQTDADTGCGLGSGVVCGNSRIVVPQELSWSDLAYERRNSKLEQISHLTKNDRTAYSTCGCATFDLISSFVLGPT